jgi:hypothetical protein
MSSETASLSIEHELCEVEGERPRVRCVLTVGECVLGDPETLNDVTGIAAAMDVLLRHEGNRVSDELFAMPLERLFRHMEIGVFVYADAGLDGGSDWQRYLRFVALPREVAAFQGWSAFLIENGQLGRLVWRAPGQPTLQQAFLERGVLDVALKRFQDELEDALAARRSVIPTSGERVKAKLRDVG